MNHEFCMECGHKNLFEVSRPKFCAGCGKGLNSHTSASKIKKTVSREEDEDTDEDGGFDVDSIDINKLRKSISFNVDNSKVSLDQLWSNPAPNDGYRRPDSESASGAELLKSFVKECAPVRSTKEIDE